MRAALLRRRRRAIKNLIYAAITATNPAVFVPLEYAVNPDTVEQILFQASSATVPVEEISDPIGSGVWDEDIAAKQDVDALRPLWGGKDVGGIFDGNAFLESPFTQLSPVDSWTLHLLCRRTSGSNQSLITWSDSGSSIGYLLWAQSDRRMGIRVGIGTQALSAPESWPIGWHVITLRNTGASGVHSGFVDGEQVVSQGTPSSPQVPDTSIASMIGARNDGSGGGEFFFTGDIAYVVAYDVAQDDTKVQDIANILGDFRP